MKKTKCLFDGRSRKGLLALHEAIQEIMGENLLDDTEVRKSVDKDTHLKEEIPEGGI